MSWQPENKNETSLIPGKDAEANFGSLQQKLDAMVGKYNIFTF
jgi:hypothetical protein